LLHVWVEAAEVMKALNGIFVLADVHSCEAHIFGG
jgi:hypothetical protein